MTKTVYLVTSNEYKFEEYQRLFHRQDVSLNWVMADLDELQTMDYMKIAKAKSVAAYEEFGRPSLTEVCGIGVNLLDGFPSGLNRQFWKTLGPKVSAIANAIGDEAVSTALLSYCDGKRVLTQIAQKNGRIASVPSINGPFHLDQVFIPDGAEIPLADMITDERDKWSSRADVTSQMTNVLKSLGVC